MSLEQQANPIKQYRKACGMSQQQLGERMGIAKSTVSRMESPGANVTLETLLRAVNAMGGRLLMIAQFADGTVSKYVAGDSE